MSPPAERRQHPRLALAGRAVIQSSVPRGQTGLISEIRDISSAGIRCVLPTEPLGVDDGDAVVELTLPTRWGSRVLRLPARLVRSGPEPSTYAFEFAETGTQDLKRLEAFLGRAAVASRRVLEGGAGIDRQVEEALRMVELGLPPHEESRPRVVMLTTPTPAETAFLAAGLAVVLAARGGAVLAVDLDFDNPSLHRFLGAGLSPGVAEWMRNGASDPEIARRAAPGIGGVRVLPAGDALLKRMSPGRVAIASLVRVLREADARYVIVNAPACLVSADAGLWAEVVDDVLLVIRSAASTEAELVEAGALLARHGGHLRGVILTDHQSASGQSSRVWAFLRRTASRVFGQRRAAAEPNARSTIVRRPGSRDDVATGELQVKNSR